MAGQALTISQALAITKVYFVEEGALFESDTYDNNLLKLIPKLADAQGDQCKQPLLDGQVAGNSGDYASAIAGITAGSQVAFALPWVNRYQGALVDDKLARLTTTNRGGFIQAKELAIRSAGSHFNDCTNYQFFRASDGAIGQVASGTNGPSWTTPSMTITCTADTSVNVLQRIKTNGTALVAGAGTVGGTILNFSAGGAIGIAAGPQGPIQAGDWVVTSIGDTSFTVSPLVGAVMITGSAFIYAKGDAQNQLSGTSVVASFAGLASWTPTTAAGALTTFGGVDRSVNTISRAGQRVLSVSSVHEAFIAGGNKAMLRGAKTTHILCHPDRFNDLVNELQDAKRYVPGTAPQRGTAAMPAGMKLKSNDAARFGFDAITLSQYGGRTIAVVPDWACQSNVSWMVDMTKYKFRHSKEGYPYNRGVMMDGADWFRQASVNWLLELFGIGQVTCADPSKQVAVVHTPSASS
jgi:hypothetical protein